MAAVSTCDHPATAILVDPDTGRVYCNGCGHTFTHLTPEDPRVIPQAMKGSAAELEQP